MLTVTPSSAASAPELAQLERIQQSAAFRTSEIHRNLLGYLVERSVSGVGDSVKEYTIGLDVFHKPPSYDPRSESTVRMHIARLRQKLADYYQTEGASDTLVIGLPKGGFKISFTARPEMKPVVAAVVENEAKSSSRPFPLRIALGAALLVIIVIGVVLFQRNWAGPRVQTTDVDRLWEPLLTSHRHLIICLTDNPSLPGVKAEGAADSAFLLGQFLAPRKKDVSLENSEHLSMVQLGMDNMVFVGPTSGNRHLQMLLANLDFVLEPGGIRNLKPRVSEPVLLSDQSGGADVEETYGLITHLPGLNGEGDSLYLSGNKTSSVVGLVRTFTDPSWARVVISHLGDAKRLSRYYQLVVKIRSMDGTPLDVTYVMHRELGMTAP